MKILKKNIIAIISFIMGAILASGIAVYAVVNASDISYTRTGTNITNVADALNDLYNKNNNSKVEVYNDLFNNNKFQLKNGVGIKKDENNDYYFDFDGVDDYIEIPTIPATANFQDGLTIEFKAKWDAFNNFSRMFDFGIGQNNSNIFVSNYSSTGNLTFGSRVGSTAYFENNAVDIGLSEVAEYKIVISKNSNTNYTFDFYKNNESITSQTLNGSFSNVERTTNYLAKSNFSGDGYFKGRIYKMKIDLTDGTNIVDIDANNIFK